MSLYRFKSRETGDLVMLEQHGKRLLEILGKDPSGPGVVMHQQMPAAIQSIRDAIVIEEADQKKQIEQLAPRVTSTVELATMIWGKPVKNLSREWRAV